MVIKDLNEMSTVIVVMKQLTVGIGGNTPPLDRTLVDEANEVLNRAAAEAFCRYIGHLVLDPKMAKGDLFRLLKVEESESDLLGPRTKGGVSSD